MRKINIGLNLSVLLMALLSLVACNEDAGNNSRPVQLAEALTYEDLMGVWTMDVDRSSEYNLAMTMYDFNQQQSSIRFTLLDIDSARVYDESRNITSVEIVNNYLPDPNDNGHKEALNLHFEGEEKPRTFLVDAFNRDSILLYLPVEVEGHEQKVPFKLVRKDAPSNTAQPLELTQEEIDAMIGCLTQMTDIQSNGSIDRKNWMGKLDGRLLLCDIAIPGTHDSGTSTVDYLAESAALTQELDLAEQWDEGIRAFDLRVRDWPLVAGGIELCHGPVSCNVNFTEAMQTIINKVKGTKECAIILINTEDNPISGLTGSLPVGILAEIVQTLLMKRLVAVRTNELDEALSRERINKVLKEILDEDMLCLYRPDLTLEEARGKIIIFNRMPSDYVKKGYPFVGQVLPNDFDIEHPDKAYCFKKAIKENDWYFAKPSVFSSNAHFDQVRKDEYDNLAALSNHQLETAETKTLFCNNPSSSYPEIVLGWSTPMCNYASAAENIYPHMIKTNERLRSCGIFRQDYAGIDKTTHVTLNQLVLTIIAGLPSSLVSPLTLSAVVRACQAIQPSTMTYGDKLMQSVLNMNFIERPVREIIMNKTFIDGNKGHKEKLSVTPLPRDANKGRDIISWVSDNTGVATVDNEGNVEIIDYGNAIITATSENGCKAITYICCKRNSPRPLELGLSVKWADRNLGAANANNEGILFAWADSALTYAYRLDKYKWTKDGQMTKYNATDGRLTINLEDDLAHKMLGGKWRMPTREEVEELINGAVITPIEIEGGRRALQLERNGVKMILPETSYRDQDGVKKATPAAGYFWTSTICQDATTHAANWYQAYCLRTEITQNFHVGIMNFGRHYAMPVRPVQDR